MVDVTSDCDSDLLTQGHLSGLSTSSPEHHHYLSVIFQAHIYLDMFYPLCCCSVAQPCLTLCDPMDCSTPGFPVLHCFLEFT